MYETLIDSPYQYTSNDAIYAVTGKAKEVSRAALFSKGQPCLRASALAKRYGWGIHFNKDAKVAPYPLGSEAYQRLSNDPSVRQVTAMRNGKKPDAAKSDC